MYGIAHNNITMLLLCTVYYYDDGYCNYYYIVRIIDISKFVVVVVLSFWFTNCAQGRGRREYMVKVKTCITMWEWKIWRVLLGLPFSENVLWSFNRSNNIITVKFNEYTAWFTKITATMYSAALFTTAHIL